MLFFNNIFLSQRLIKFFTILVVILEDFYNHFISKQF